MTQHNALKLIAVFLSTAFISGLCIFGFQQLTSNKPGNTYTSQSEDETHDYSNGGARDPWTHGSLPLDAFSESTPLRIKIPQLDVDSKVVPVGINPDQSMEVPSNIANIGWYEPGPYPGDPVGSAVLAGHRDGAEAGRGAFYNLGELERGDVITLATKSEKLKFEVMRTEVLDKRTFTLRSQEIFASDGPGVLTLITCGGDYDSSRGGYQANVIVTAKKVTLFGDEQIG